jgi:membrane protein YqaA with SNARE-associated domain
LGSLLGGVAGYALGALAWGAISSFFFDHVPGFTHEKFEFIQSLYKDWDFWIVFTAGFTPIPYKVITIASGVVQLDFTTFAVVSILSRGARFFLVAALLWRFGAPIRGFVEARLGLLALLFFIMLFLGFIVIGMAIN